MNYAYIDPGTGMTIASSLGWLIAIFAALAGLFAVFFKRIFNFFKNNKKFIFIIAAVIVIALIVAGVLMNKKESDFDKKIVILGFDGLSPNIIEPMMRDGELPNFSSLKKQGSYHRIATTNPSQSPVAWAGFSTGRNPGEHGVFDFIVRDPRTYKLTLSLSNIKGGKPKKVVKTSSFWDYTSKDRIPTVIIGCPVTFPPDKVYGRMISGMGVPDILGTEGTFSFFTTQKEDKEKEIGGMVFHIRNSPTIVSHLLGPKKAKVRAEAENVKVPFSIKPQNDRQGIEIEFQNQTFFLEAGKWSDWKNISFDLGMGRKLAGILRFYLVEVDPEIKLYTSPINFDPRDPFFPISYPEEYAGELVTAVGLFHTQGMPMDTWAVNEGRLAEDPHIEQIKEVFREKKAMLDYELGRLEKGVLLCYFESSDVIQHMFWRYTDQNHPLYEADAKEEYKQLIYEWYKRMDTVLGEVMETVGEDDIIIALSDHGFDTFRRAVHINTWLRENGYLELKDPYAESGSELLSDIDWTQTKAYAIGFGAIYLNMKGREGDGIVKPDEAEKLKAEIAEKLKDWVDPKYNAKVVSEVYSRDDMFSGKYEKDTPDLYIGFNIGYRASWQTALGAVPEASIEDNLKKWSGSHLIDPKLIPGVVFTNRKVTKKDPSLYDITPTVLKIIGYDYSTLEKLNFDGAPLF
ncbi:MAG: alkaline phosphatase family protein [Spirochaetota bacterium]|nr:MAG: alkaline phosphatase family protein [Spirochaetota bacterium]